jgi:hypothetical protein
LIGISGGLFSVFHFNRLGWVNRSSGLLLLRFILFAIRN